MTGKRQRITEYTAKLPIECLVNIFIGCHIYRVFYSALLIFIMQFFAAARCCCCCSLLLLLLLLHSCWHSALSSSGNGCSARAVIHIHIHIHAHSTYSLVFAAASVGRLPFQGNGKEQSEREGDAEGGKQRKFHTDI